MNWEVAGLKLRNQIKFLVRIAGLALVLLGAYNMFLGPVNGALFVEYRQLGLIMSQQGQSAFFLSDVVVMAVGAVIAWFT